MTKRIAVIGADHAGIVAEALPGATRQVVCDLDEARARSVAETHGVPDVAAEPEAVQALEDGRRGRALMMHNVHRKADAPAADCTGAMAITNSAPHEFDGARHVLGAKYSAISAFQARRPDSRVAPVAMVPETTDGQLVRIEINNNAGYGYDVRAELVGEICAIALNSVAYTRLDRGLAQSTRHDANRCTRFGEASRRQNRNSLRRVQTRQFPELGSDCWDGYCAAIAAEAGVRARKEGRECPVAMIARPEFYA